MGAPRVGSVRAVRRGRGTGAELRLQSKLRALLRRELLQPTQLRAIKVRGQETVRFSLAFSSCGNKGDGIEYDKGN